MIGLIGAFVVLLAAATNMAWLGSAHRQTDSCPTTELVCRVINERYGVRDCAKCLPNTANVHVPPARSGK
jgi:hypothetical protein